MEDVPDTLIANTDAMRASLDNANIDALPERLNDAIAQAEAVLGQNKPNRN